jgi:predicted TPR repeat methyltransferase
MAFLRRTTNRFDLIAAADLLVYFGDLISIFEAVATALKPAGLFAFNTESWNGDGYRLLPSGRFSHAPEYVRRAAGRIYLEVFHAETTMRLEATGRVPGNVMIFRRLQR